MAKKKFLTYGLFFVLLICFYVKNIFSQQNLSQKNLNLAVSIPINFNPLLNQNPDMDNILKLIFEPMIKFQNEKPINNLQCDGSLYLHIVILKLLLILTQLLP